MVFIITKNDNILTTCDTLDNVYHNILIYTRIILYCDKNKIDYFNDLKITEYSNGYPVESYEISENLDIYNSKNELIDIHNNILNRNKLELEVLIKKDNIESDINIFIPLDNQVSEQKERTVKPISKIILSHFKNQQNKKIVQRKSLDFPSLAPPNIKNNNSDNQKAISLNEINRIKELKEKIEMEKNRLNSINENYDKKLNKYLDTKHEYGLLECELKNNKEKADEDRRIFITDKHIYSKICTEIENESRDPSDIPPIFKIKFEIFKELNNKIENINLSDSEGYEEYKNIYCQKNSENVTTKYDNMFKDDNPFYSKLISNLNNLNSENSDNISDISENSDYNSESDSE